MAEETTAAAAAGSTETTAESGSLLERILSEGRLAREDAESQKHARDLLQEFIDQTSKGLKIDEKTKDTVRAIEKQVAEIDKLISAQLNEILHSPEYQRLEASWRGLHHLVKNTETGNKLKLRLLNITKSELLKDLESASEFDQSSLFKKVYEEEYGTFGGHPFGLLIGDYEFDRVATDISLLGLISNAAAAAHAPFIAAASPGLFDMKSFTELGNPRDLAKIFESTELIPWTSFRESEDSRYVALTLPHVMMRLPYGPKTVPIEEFHFDEEVDGTDHSKYLWGNAAYFLGQRITNAFAKYGWCAAIRGLEGGGQVEGLPSHTFKTAAGETIQKCPTEVAITDRRENELNNLGFISLVHCKSTDYAVFFGGQTTQKPAIYDLPEATANARLSAMLPYMLAASRFAHYLKAICRDKIGSFMTAENLSLYLNRWIGNYVLARDDAGQDLKASSPLRSARVDVKDVAGRPGAYKAVVFLRPHFQLEELTTSIRLVASLPPPAA